MISASIRGQESSTDGSSSIAARKQRAPPYWCGRNRPSPTLPTRHAATRGGSRRTNARQQGHKRGNMIFRTLKECRHSIAHDRCEKSTSFGSFTGTSMTVMPSLGKTAYNYPAIDACYYRWTSRVPEHPSRRKRVVDILIQDPKEFLAWRSTKPHHDEQAISHLAISAKPQARPRLGRSSIHLARSGAIHPISF